MQHEPTPFARVLDAILARSGAVAHVGIVGAQGFDKFVIASYRCYVRQTEEMLMAIPLEIRQEDRTIVPGANVFDLAIQGYFSGNPKLRAANFEYIFNMGPLRSREYAALHPDDPRPVTEAVNGWIAGLKALPESDLSETEGKLNKYDTALEHVLRARLMLASGDAESHNISLSSYTAAAWLANYLR
jgi:hypothetical protein